MTPTLTGEHDCKGVSETGCCAVSAMGLFFSTKKKTKEQSNGSLAQRLTPHRVVKPFQPSEDGKSKLDGFSLFLTGFSAKSQ